MCTADEVRRALSSEQTETENRKERDVEECCVNPFGLIRAAVAGIWGFCCFGLAIREGMHGNTDGAYGYFGIGLIGIFGMAILLLITIFTKKE